MTLFQEKKSFKDANGQELSYCVYYVEVNGIKVELKPKDATSKQILNNYFEKGGK